MTPVVQAAGIIVVAVTLADIYLTVLQGGAVSLFSNRVNMTVWRVFTLARGLLGPRARPMLAYAGPTLIAVTVLLWVSLLLLGFALIYWPVLGEDIVASDGPTPTSFATALYVSGFSVSTLGTGDLTAQTGTYRLVTVLEAVLGFSIVTASLTYLLSVYSAVTRNNAAASWLHHATSDRASAAHLVARLGPGGDFSNAAQTVSTISHDLVQLIESHHTYVVLRYFRFSNPSLSIPRIAYLVLDTAAIIRCALPDDSSRTFRDSVAVAQLQAAGEQMVNELARDFLPPGLVERKAGALEPDAWRAHFQDAVDTLRAEGIPVVDDVARAADRYVIHRRAWLPLVAAFADYLDYDWDSIAPGI